MIQQTLLKKFKFLKKKFFSSIFDFDIIIKLKVFIYTWATHEDVEKKILLIFFTLKNEIWAAALNLKLTVLL